MSDQPFPDDDSLVAPETVDADGSRTDPSAHTHDVPMDPDGSGRVITAADRADDPRLDDQGPPPADVAADGGPDSASAGRAQ